MAEHILLDPGVARFLEPMRILGTRVGVSHRVNAFVNHGIHLRHAITVGATGIETVKRIKRSCNSRVISDISLPTAGCIRLAAPGASPRTIIINRTILAVLRLGIRSPTQGVVEVTEIRIVFFQDAVDGHVRNARIPIGSPIKRPPFSGFFPGNAGAVVVKLRRWLNDPDVRFGVVIQVRAVARPNVSVAVGGKSPGKGPSQH